MQTGTLSAPSDSGSMLATHFRLGELHHNRAVPSLLLLLPGRIFASFATARYRKSRRRPASRPLLKEMKTTVMTFSSLLLRLSVKRSKVRLARSAVASGSASQTCWLCLRKSCLGLMVLGRRTGAPSIPSDIP